MAQSELYKKGEAIRRQLRGDAEYERNKREYDADPAMKKFIDVATETVFGALWARPGLDLKTRTLVCVVSDAATGTLRCQVQDTGTGISADTLPCVFEPYFTTKARDRGAGLGLTVVKNLVEAAGGAITIQSRLGEGTIVSFELPLVNAAQSRWRPA